MQKYDPKKIEPKWQKHWEKNGINKTKTTSDKPKYYILDMFPYPSGAGLHVGHPKGYIATDVVARMKMMQGFNVLHPMGWDAFGLPAENYAIANKVHPKEATDKNIATFKNQLSKIGFTYDWDREVNTTDPKYYKWTQWIFVQLFKKGLAYESNEPVNWCPTDKTVLSNEDLEDGKCERCGSVVERKPMRQWVLKITKYADRMLEDLAKLPDWPEAIKEMQKNWIGKSPGAEIKFLVRGQSADHAVPVFTTRPDTLFGVTYLAVSAELAKSWLNMGWKPEQKVVDYIEETLKKVIAAKDLDTAEKTGIPAGFGVVNPATDKEVPLWITNYVLGNVGTGAVMGVPAHDERDFAFAKKYDLRIKNVVCPTQEYWKNNIFEEKTELQKWLQDQSLQNPQAEKMWQSKLDSGYGIYKSKLENNEIQVCFTEPGFAINSGFLNELATNEAKEEMIQRLEKEKKGNRKIIYKLRDWVFSRQRYWGEPIPIIHCAKCGAVPVPESQLPIELPKVKQYEPTGTGESPLANIEEWMQTTCPTCGGNARRESNTMPQWAGSSWYYLRYIDPHNDKELVDKKLEKYWSPVDFYVGGAEHATRHLIYARFWHKFLFDIGVVNYEEPFKRLQNVGLIMAEDGRKMSKRWGNVINPDDVINEYGADSLRLYEMFMGPFAQTVAWSTNGLIGAHRFIEKVWYLQDKLSKEAVMDRQLQTTLHQTIKKVGDDIEDMRFNTAIAKMMELANDLSKAEKISEKDYGLFVRILAPFAPHLSEELWSVLGNKESVFVAPWPTHDAALAQAEKVTIAVQVNGKLRDTLEVAPEEAEEKVKALALASEKVQKWLEGKTPKKVIYVKGKLVSIVV